MVVYTLSSLVELSQLYRVECAKHLGVKSDVMEAVLTQLQWKQRLLTEMNG